MGKSTDVFIHPNNNALDKNGYATLLWYSLWCLF